MARINHTIESGITLELLHSKRYLFGLESQFKKAVHVIEGRLQGKTFEEIARSCNRTRERMRQIEVIVLEAIRKDTALWVLRSKK